MNAQASDANNATNPFRSSGPPTRFSGACWRHLVAHHLEHALRSSWSGKKPGAIAFTLMLYCAHSTASERVKLTTPPLLVL